jgi:hypothetical protein
VRVEDWKL